jgi:ABC-type taurine transport system substrate-binding protein
VYVDTAVVGSFEPQQTGISGTVYVDDTSVGSFSSLQQSGYVYVDTAQVGTYEIPTLIPTILTLTVTPL